MRWLWISLLCVSGTDIRPDALKEINAFIAEAKSSGKIDTSSPDWKTRLPEFPKVPFADGEHYEWILETTEGTLTAQLEEEKAPDHVRNLLYLTSLGYYDGLIFHRIIPGFMAQGGCPLGTGSGGPGYHVGLEAKPELGHDRPGILSMARARHPDSAGSQFFITFKKTEFLNGGYTVFGHVSKGMEVLKRLEAAGNPNPNANGSPPLKVIRIKSARIQRVDPDPLP